MTDVVFYIAGHPDDAVLFRGDQLYIDTHDAGVRLIHITVSAGDAGRTDGWWQMRERGTTHALMAAQSPDVPLGSGRVTVNGHSITRYTGMEFSAYCLRLPDGGLDGNGFPATGNRSLSRLESRTMSSIAAVDGSTTYTSWADLCATLRAIHTRERQASTTVNPWINASDPDRALNPGDHPDHYAVGDALRTFVASDGYLRAWWVSYDVRNRPANLGGFDLACKRFLFEAHGWETGGPNETEWGWWGTRRYDRVEV